jgi:beta-xylosidase
VQWQDGWPMMGRSRDGVAEPVLHHSKPAAVNGHFNAPQTSDEFDSPALGLQWQWHANHADQWQELGCRKSWLRLHPQFTTQQKLTQLPNLLLQKFPARAFAVETSLDFSSAQPGEEAGLIIAGQSFAALALEKTDAGNRLVLNIDGAQTVIRTEMPDFIQLRVAVAEGGRCSFSFATTDGSVALAETFQANKGVWIAAKIGLYSVTRRNNQPTGHADFDCFRFK